MDCCEEDVAAAALIHFCSAGDTRQEAGQLASLVHSWLQVFDPEVNEQRLSLLTASPSSYNISCSFNHANSRDLPACPEE